MGIFDRFPYSSTHEMNLDFMLGKATEIAEDMQTVTAGMAQVQAGLSAISEKTEQATQAAAQAAASASSIEGSVTAAEEAAEEAQMHNESAQTWANNALTYKADCQRAATEAAASSSSAAQAATAAAASEDTVATYAQAANASAQSAANNNDSAHQYANQASASASNATFHSSNAQTAATNANTSATNAQTAATNAQTAATRTAALKDDCETLHSMCVAAVDQAAEQAVAAANSAAQAAASKTDVENLVESLPEDFTDLNNTVNQLSDEIVDINNEKSSNLYSGMTLISGRVYQGTYSDAITTVHCTDFIQIIPGHVYAVYGGYITPEYSNYYDANKTYKGPLPLTGLINTYPYNLSSCFLLFTAPNDAKYTRINYLNSDLINGSELKPEWYFRDVTESITAQKKVLVVGDSISTDYYGNYKKWVSVLLDSGFFSIGLTKNSSQHATGFVATYTGDTNTTFLARVTALGDISDRDIVITFGGINDWIQSVPFADFQTAVDAYFAYLIEHATQARIIVLSPLHTALYGTTNNVGKTQKDYADYIKEVAKSYAFPLLNLTDESGFCPDKSQTFNDMWTLLPAGYTDHDGVHPNADWEKKYLAPQIASFISGLI